MTAKIARYHFHRARGDKRCQNGTRRVVILASSGTCRRLTQSQNLGRKELTERRFPTRKQGAEKAKCPFHVFFGSARKCRRHRLQSGPFFLAQTSGSGAPISFPWAASTASESSAANAGKLAWQLRHVDGFVSIGHQPKRERIGKPASGVTQKVGVARR